MAYDTYCSHIEHKLPSKHKGRLAVYVQDIERYPEPPSSIGLDEQLYKLERKLRTFGLSRKSISVIIAKIGEGLSFEDIVLQYGDSEKWDSKGAVSYYYQKAIRQLRKFGFR